MNYQSLYRKWRPLKFSQVIGQEHITLTLKNENLKNQISHAYLFTGTRGTGKTSCARILAKAINCLSPINGDACCECENCRLIQNFDAVDIIEIDAASNNGVDDIRLLRENINYTPAVLKYKVYIIDEVHMLSTPAFNALLKTLEEPPSHVVFILGTTEVQKIPLTILSRCQRFDFKRISVENIAKLLKQISESESISIEDSALNYIAKLSDGAMRDALSILDQCRNLSDKITLENVRAAMGSSQTEKLTSLISYIYEENISSALQTLNELYASCDMSVLFFDMIAFLRDVVIFTLTKNKEISGLYNSAFTEITEKYPLSKSIFILNSLFEYSSKLQQSVSKKTDAEVCIISLCTPSLNQDLKALTSRIDMLEKKLAGINTNQVIQKEPKQKEPENITETTPIQPAPLEKPKTPPIKDFWKQIIKNIDNVFLSSLLKITDAEIRGSTIYIKKAGPTLMDELKIPSSKAEIDNAVYKVLNAHYTIEFDEEKKEAVKDYLDDLFENNSDIIELE